MQNAKDSDVIRLEKKLQTSSLMNVFASWSLTSWDSNTFAPDGLSLGADAAGAALDPALYQIWDVSWENFLLKAHAVHQEVA